MEVKFLTNLFSFLEYSWALINIIVPIFVVFQPILSIFLTFLEIFFSRAQYSPKFLASFSHPLQVQNVLSRAMKTVSFSYTLSHINFTLHFFNFILFAYRIDFHIMVCHLLNNSFFFTLIFSPIFVFWIRKIYFRALSVNFSLLAS